MAILLREAPPYYTKFRESSKRLHPTVSNIPFLTVDNLSEFQEWDYISTHAPSGSLSICDTQKSPKYFSIKDLDLT